MSEPRRILIAGAGTGAHWNLGDAAILAAMSHQLRALGPGVELSVVSANPAGSLDARKIGEVPFDSMPELLAAAERADLMILGGGGLFFDYWDFPAGELLTPAHGGLSFYAGFAALASLLGKPLMVYGAGVGPLGTAEGRRLTREVFELADAITVRDARSAALLEELGIPRGRIEVTGDPAAALPDPPDGTPLEQLLLDVTGKPLPRPLLAVAVRPWDVGVSPSQWEGEVARGLDLFLEQRGGTALFIPFHRPVGEVDDQAAAARIAARMKRPERTVALAPDLEPEAASALIGRCDLLLGMRLHSILFAQNHAVPSMAIVYDPKVGSIMSGGFAKFAVPLETIDGESVARLLGEILDRRSELASELRGEAPHRLRAAAMNAERARTLLERGKGPAADGASRARSLIEDLALRQLRRSVELEGTVRRLEAEAVQRQEGIDWLRGEVKLRDQRIEALTRPTHEPE